MHVKSMASVEGAEEEDDHAKRKKSLADIEKKARLRAIGIALKNPETKRLEDIIAEKLVDRIKQELGERILA